MESNSFLANIDDEMNLIGTPYGDFNIMGTQVKPPTKRGKLFKFQPPAMGDFRDLNREEEKKEVKRLELVNQQRKRVLLISFSYLMNFSLNFTK